MNFITFHRISLIGLISLFSFLFFAWDFQGENELKATPIGAEPEPSHEERARLKFANGAELKNLTEIVNQSKKLRLKPGVALYRIADLRSVDAFKVLESFYETSNNPSDRLEILILIKDRIALPECVPLLMKATRDSGWGGDERWYAAQALSSILGTKALPRLREMRNDEKPTVRRIVRTELAKLGDMEAIQEIIEDLKLKDTSWESLSKIHQAIEDIAEGHLLQGLPPLRLLMKQIDKSDADNIVNLKARACCTALHLGDLDSVPIMVGLTGKDTGGLPISSPREVLTVFTKVDHGDNKGKWLEWWNREGKKEPLFSSFIVPKEKQAIAKAILAWGRGKEAGPYLNAGVVYVEKDRTLLELENEKTRFYTQTDMKLLDISMSSSSACNISDFTSNGKRAFAVLGRPGMPHHTSFFIVELKREKDAWKVLAAEKKHVNK